MLLSERPPFHDQHKSLYSVITSGMFDHMTGACWARVSSLARDLVSKLLDIDQEKRLTGANTQPPVVPGGRGGEGQSNHGTEEHH